MFTMKPLAILAIYTLANVGIGYLVLSLIARLFSGVNLEWSNRAYPIIFQFSLGSALLSGLWLLLGLGGFLRGAVVWLVLLPLFALAARSLLRGRVLELRLASLSGLQVIHTNPAFSLLVTLISGVALWLGVLAYLRPPFGDADAFYMVYPKIIAATGALIAMPGGYHDFSTIGLSGELHFAALMVIGTPAMAKLFAWIAGIGMILLLKDITRRVGGGMVAQVVAIAMLITSTTFSDYLSDGKTDLFAALIGLAAIYSLLLARESPMAKIHIAIAGLLTGFALTAKLSFIVALLPAVALLVILQEVSGDSYSPISDRFKRTTKALAILCLGISIAFLPHLLKNQLLFGHALAPFVGMKENWANQPAWFSPTDTLRIVSTYPAALVFGLYPLMGGNMSFLWLAAFPLILFVPRHEWSLRNPLVQVTLSAVAGLICWLAVKGSVFAPRYILTTLVLLIPLPAIAFEYIWLNESRPRLISLGFTVLAAIALLAVPFTPPAGVWTALPEKIITYIKDGRPECGLAISSYCEGLNSLNVKAIEGERVFIAGYYTYWLRPDLLQCINEPDDYGLFNQVTSSEVWSALYHNGFAHIAVQKATHGQYLKMLSPKDAPAWLKVTSELEDSDMPVFHISALDPNRRPVKVCARNDRNSWATGPK